MVSKVLTRNIMVLARNIKVKNSKTKISILGRTLDVFIRELNVVPKIPGQQTIFGARTIVSGVNVSSIGSSKKETINRLKNQIQGTLETMQGRRY